MDDVILAAINNARTNRQAIAVVTTISSGENRVVGSQVVSTDPLADEIAARFKSGKSALIEGATGEEFFVQVYVPPPRLVIIGAVHISQALAPMARACDFDVMVIDPRTAFATPERFADTELHGDWPEHVLKNAPLDAFTALVAVTHDPKIDDFPLQEALNTGCFYVGALGSRKTHAKRVSRFEKEGISQEAIDKIHAPIGLNIAAATPAEIAVAVLAEIIQRLRQGESV